MKYNKWLCHILLAACLLSATGSPAQDAHMLPATSPQIEVGFSPEGGAEQLVLKVIHAAHSSIRLAAYSLTSRPIVQALEEAQRRGVNVAVIADYRSNMEDSRNDASKRALASLAEAGISLRLIRAYEIHHDKYIVVDGMNVETGSFNFTRAAAQYNSENVLVVWHNPQLAEQYLDHWQNRWAQAEVWNGGR